MWEGCRSVEVLPSPNVQTMLLYSPSDWLMNATLRLVPGGSNVKLAAKFWQGSVCAHRLRGIMAAAHSRVKKCFIDFFFVEGDEG